MNALELTYDDASFDGAFSSSSIEHFGDFDSDRLPVVTAPSVRSGVSSNPEGIAAQSTEYLIQGKGPGLTGTLIFDKGRPVHVVIRRSGRR